MLAQVLLHEHCVGRGSDITLDLELAIFVRAKTHDLTVHLCREHSEYHWELGPVLGVVAFPDVVRSVAWLGVSWLHQLLWHISTLRLTLRCLNSGFLRRVLNSRRFYATHPYYILM